MASRRTLRRSAGPASLAFAFTTLAFLAGSVNAERALSVRITGQPEVDGVDNFQVISRVMNTGDEELKLYNDPTSLLTAFPENTFHVTAGDDGRVAKFIGPHAKYSFKLAQSFTTLAAGESTVITHDVGEGYEFITNGDWTVAPNLVFHYQDPETGEPVPITASIDRPYSAKLTGSLISAKVGNRHLRKRAEFTGCSNSFRADIQAAFPYSNIYLANAEKYLTEMTGPTPRYTQWFGTFSSSNRDTVLQHYNRIRTSNIKAYEYDCSCTDDVYAFVYPDIFGVVHLCNTFWLAPTFGEDSKAGTIIHEASHFTRNGGTDDIAYGHELAGQLADSRPSSAIMNADSHEYFAENDPFIA